MTMPAASPLAINEQVARELERLKKRLINADRAGADRSRRISFVYRAAESFSRRVFGSSLCRAESEGAGCKTGQCCKCSPDVFACEKEVLDLLPKRSDDSGFCPFFNLQKRNCGIYGVRPFACRIYYNFAPSSYYCQNPNDLTLLLFDGVRRHLEQILGPYCGGYRP
ncbi:iron-sulfur cluster-binding oxidoreductase, UPF0153 superfamily, putative [Citrifermentans bemidjiense Bem]|uniref:Iron-sulfur cluster-binding oxidoreductase, UPF0153 superfamily, putative n=1 Tax=Citrifermentans bemidjiense (strain ATCC BAA-1014 / DSM 16622 / JCM 12645 / Bem) TaxID=404380 RepID=B5EG32_CITBB|nr:hypothetical protein [Citrifermentans bemidjiense]ACH39497.1 iron-sulfur cluster-binding oxidoreductase, UPF0153 superfamily, putative [Citrifermentans bemidjiense Bem]